MKIPKILAMYLPQFHRVKENDEWWGEGFTEWSTVKEGKSLYPGHEQPVRPMEYYDLMDKDVMCRQAEYMHRYGVDGMCFYHYYFENGRQILEKPAENLLRWTDIDMPFCFYWANESWIRSWSNVSGNSWTELFESEERQVGESVLLRQNYGDRADWEEHFRYLLPFFKDDRYLKKEGRPLFLIYNPGDIEHLAEMKNCWNELMEKEGMLPIFFIGRGSDNNILDRSMIHEPADTWGDLRERRFQNPYGFQYYLSYDEVWEKILSRKYIVGNAYIGGFVGYDDSPRRGYRGRIMYGGTPEKFKKYFIRLLLKADKVNSEFIFINAWNEWGEGMYLEPDEKWGFKYLQAIKSAKVFVEEYGDTIEASWTDNLFTQEDDRNRGEIEILFRKNERYRGYWKILSRWLAINLCGESICEYFYKNADSRVAVYGLGLLGIPFVDEMQNHNMQIAYGIDQDDYKGKRFDFPVYKLQDDLPETDIIVITVEYVFDNIKQQLARKSKCKFLSLYDLLDFAEQGK